MTKREIATVLAALRYFQGIPTTQLAKEYFPDHFADCAPLNGNEIGELCEKLNLGEEKTPYQPKTGEPCSCRRGLQRDNCSACEGTGMRIDFAAIRRRK